MTLLDELMAQARSMYIDARTRGANPADSAITLLPDEFKAMMLEAEQLPQYNRIGSPPLTGPITIHGIRIMCAN